ncbi:DUF1176 domain-containing protein [Phenylobacterium sp.]|uniref:DUF1176 domain-containing protein n=1 Tax=Phenylobacterium sp. TaxID=1871053 RepID=UPI0027268D31|nr:DUF1176 domain-containing protein [Phenylobacterium sp.]MDO8379809.1 DUF1176 domain-containing protein [Phenylobacterium sp.]
MKSMIAALLGVLVATTAQAASRSFQDWTVVCDNTRNCTAYGFSAEDSEEQPFLRVDRPAAAAAARIKLVMVGENGPGAVWAVRVDGKPVPGLAPRAKGNAEVVLTAPQGRALLAAIRNGSRLSLAPGRGDVLLSGSAAALRWMDDQQRRAGTVTALVAAGPKPASAVPPPPPIPLVRRGPVVSQEGLPEKLPPGMRALLGEDCDETLDEEDYAPIIARLSPGVVLFGELCYRGAYNEIYGFLLADEQGGHARRAQIPNLDGSTTHLLMNVDFDPETQTLSNFEKGRGIADCGGAYSWIWDGRVFRVSEQVEMPACRGLPAEEWPVLFRSRRK